MTRGQMEDTIAKEVTQFYAEAIGVGPRQSKAYITHDMVLVRLKGNTHPYEHILLKKQGGIKTVKHMRTTILESVVDDLMAIVEKHTNTKVISVHSDSSTRTGERFVIFILDKNLD
ncbi:MAG: DUF2294 domain-containing protein [Candidatus Roizmanbacteria bacterium]|nr:DUF2294 domain-containing protein [Candidatus Roizmanbacteria bacterium]